MIGESLFFLGIALLFSSCKNSDSKSKSLETPLVIEYVMNIYEPLDSGQLKLSMNRKDKVWYRDSLAIESVSKVHIISDKTGTRQDLQLLYYRFSDLKKNWAYEYDSFSDTAKLLRKYSYNDTVQVINGWNFKFKRKWDYNGNPEILPDTTVDGVLYKRARLMRGPQTDPNIAICFFRCDKNFQIFVLDSFLSEMIGCPFVKGFISSPSKKEVSLSNEIVFLANEFTPAEQKVFDAWEKNIKKYTIVK